MTRIADKDKKEHQEGKTYPLSVDYGRSVEHGVKAGCFGHVDSDITSHNFPTKRRGTTEIEVELVHFNRPISTNEALRELGRMGYRPAELRELLAFGERYPEVQRELFVIIALGSVWQSHGHGYVFLGMCGSSRSLSLVWNDYQWGDICRFAAVRK